MNVYKAEDGDVYKAIPVDVRDLVIKSLKISMPSNVVQLPSNQRDFSINVEGHKNGKKKLFVYERTSQKCLSLMKMEIKQSQKPLLVILKQLIVI